jgi:hypothetical protein
MTTRIRLACLLLAATAAGLAAWQIDLPNLGAVAIAALTEVTRGVVASLLTGRPEEEGRRDQA